MYILLSKFSFNAYKMSYCFQQYENYIGIVGVWGGLWGFGEVCYCPPAPFSSSKIIKYLFKVNSLKLTTCPFPISKIV